MADTSRIHSLVGRARNRLKLQAALDAAVLAVIPAAASAAGAVFLVRSETLSEAGGFVLLGACAAMILVGGAIGWMRFFPTARVATRIDRACGLADRLATACAFEEELKKAPPPEADAEGWETRALMEAAIADAVRAAPRADVKAATPFSWPRDTRAALAFTAAAAIVAGLYLEPKPTNPIIAAIDPPAASRGTEIEIHGTRLATGGTALLGGGAGAPALDVIEWTPERIRARIPAAAKVGPTVLTVRTDGGVSTPLDFEVLPDGMKHKDRDQPIALADDDLDYTRDLVDELRKTAEANQDDDLKQLAQHIEKLLDQAEKGELSREQLLDELAKAHDKYMEGASEKMMEEGLADLKKTGKELEKSELTKEMGKALSQGDLEKAQKEMEKLAEKLAKGEVSEKQAQEAAKAMEKAAKAFEKRQAEREKSAEQKVSKAEKELRDAEKKAAEAKTPEQKAKAEKQRAEKQKNLDKQQQEKEQQQASKEKRELKRLHRNMKQASEQMGDKDQEKRKQASRTMQDMSRDTGKVDADKRKMTNQKKVASQLDDLKEAMRRAKKGGTRGPQDKFGRNKKNDDFQKRARGGKGSRQAWKPGQGQKGGQGQGQQPGGKGQQPGGSSYGDEHDPDLIGDATKKTGNAKDESVSGVHGKGPSTRETILSAAQKGFASRSYQQVYARYKTIVEEVINAEKVPSGYKYYVKKYFQKIKPHEM